MLQDSILTFCILFSVGGCIAAPATVVAASTHLDKDRLCAELAASGLGGGACDTPSVVVEHRWRRLYQEQSQSNQSHDGLATPRRDACPVLCANGLGNPLCQCQQLLKDGEVPKANFTQICGFFCTSYSLHISGCPSCTKPIDLIPFVSASISYAPVDNKVDEEIDWEAWCKEMCSSGDGGIACNCDILPLGAILT